MKTILLILVLAAFVSSQQLPTIEQVRTDLKAIKSQQQAQAYIDKSGLRGSILELDEIQDSSAVAMKLFKMKSGDVIEQLSGDQSSTFIYKVLVVIEQEADRVQYIYFDNTKLTKKSIDSLRSVVVKRLGKGETFAALAKQYSMDPNGKRGGDSGWYDRQNFVPEFVQPVLSHKKGDVFSVDIPRNKWYYVVRKSHDPLKRKKILAVYLGVPSKP